MTLNDPTSRKVALRISGLMQTLESPSFLNSKFPGLESPGKGIGPGKPYKNLENGMFFTGISKAKSIWLEATSVFFSFSLVRTAFSQYVNSLSTFTLYCQQPTFVLLCIDYNVAKLFPWRLLHVGST